MRHVIGGLVVVLLVTGARPAEARCGDEPGDRAALQVVVERIVAQCDCCGPPFPRSITRPSFACPRRIVLIAVRTGELPRRCARAALRRGTRACRRACGARCELSQQCDDGNACTADACVAGRCRHDCLCVDPRGDVSCCPGPASECPPSGLHYFRTCGDPVCRVDPEPIPGVPPCTTQREGAACATPGEECDAGFGCNARLRCMERPPVTCPISARSAKRDVTYLTPADARRLRDELLRLRLATYQYRSEGPSAPRRLGFIIDDVGQSPAVGPDRSMVDLYGYASMAVAAIQAQGREIDLLRRDLEALRRECRAPAGVTAAAAP